MTYIPLAAAEGGQTSRRRIVSEETIQKRVSELQEEAFGSSSPEKEEESRDAPGVDVGSGIVGTSQNVLREQIKSSRLVDTRTFEIQVSRLHRPPIDPQTGRRPLEVREPHPLHVSNLRAKMKINPFANVVPF
eukprot:c29393_g2_i1 orf=3-398(-)